MHKHFEPPQLQIKLIKDYHAFKFPFSKEFDQFKARFPAFVIEKNISRFLKLAYLQEALRGQVARAVAHTRQKIL
jgi:hypothetical protein